MPHRSYASTANYRFGFNGKENDNEPKGLGNEQDYGMRIYDPRIGKFLSTDPLAKSYPWFAPYQFAGNMPISAIDIDGEEPAIGIPYIFRTISKLNLPEIYIPPPTTIPFPPILLPNPGNALIPPPAPTTVQPSIPQWSEIDLGDPNVIRIPEIDIEFVPEPIYSPKWLQEKEGFAIKKSTSYRPGELDDPSWAGGYKDKKSSKELKNKSKDDVPDWARGYRPRKGEKGEDFAKRLLDKKYGQGNWKKGPATEHNKIKKFGDTDFKTVVVIPFPTFIDLKRASEEYNKELRKAKEKVVEQIEERLKESLKVQKS